MKRILILGAGLVSRPMVRYLLDVPGFEVTVASRTLSRAEKLIAGHVRGKALQLLADQEQALDALVSAHDLTVSLLPYTYHVQVARHCLRHRKSMVTTSYVSDAMRELDSDAKDAGIMLLNEMGLDPGIDHMSAMAIIHRVQTSGGEITSFMSYCGGLPAPEANDNPLGYKFSWSPKGVVMAGRNPGRYLEDGNEVLVPGKELFGHHWPLDIEGEGRFEAYPNRDSLPYIKLYGIQTTKTILRGTLRNPGWCETLKAIADLGLLDDEEQDDLGRLTVADWMRRYVRGDGDLRQHAAETLGLDPEATAIANMAWLGMFEDEPVAIDKGSNLDIIAKLMLDRMSYKPGERDMIVLHHDFRAELPGKQARHITSTLVDYGRPEGDSAMARTVSLPAAVAVKLVLQGRIGLTGVHIPVVPELYEPVLSELETMGIVFRERGFDSSQGS
jgi:saccharopine dehydrogenase (NADP+, L-glutamate forming)